MTEWYSLKKEDFLAKIEHFLEMGHDGINTRKPWKYYRRLGYGYEARFGYWLRLREKN